MFNASTLLDHSPVSSASPSALIDALKYCSGVLTEIAEATAPSAIKSRNDDIGCRICPLFRRCSEQDVTDLFAPHY